MKKNVVCSVIALVFGMGWSAFAAAPETDIPTTAFLSASRSCTITVIDSGVTSSYGLKDPPVTAPDGGTWYGAVDRTWLNPGTRLTSSVTGYLTSWYSYGEEPESLRETGPYHMTRLLAGTNDLTLTAKAISNLFCRVGMLATDIYAKFTPIVYKVAYELNGGAFPGGASHPETATYDESFTVSAPVRDFYSFTGWKFGSKIYFKGESNDVTFVNLTAQNGATVSLGATWKGRPYPLQLVFGDGVAKIHYRTGSSAAWQTTTASKTVSVDYGETWSAWAEAAYGWEGSGTGWDPEGVSGGTMTEAGDKFKPEATRKKFELTVGASPADGGTVSGSGTYDYQAQAYLTAAPSTGNRFAGWSDGSTENPYRYRVVSNVTLEARFAVKAYDFQLIVNEGVEKICYRFQDSSTEKWPAVWVETTGSLLLDVPYGTRYQVYAVALPGYSLAGAGSSIATAVTGTVKTDGVLFAPMPTKNTYLVTVAPNPTEGGTVTVNGDGRFEAGARAKVTATAKEGWSFSQWNDVTSAETVKVSDNPVYDFTVTKSVFLEAVFTKEQFTVTFVYRLENGAAYRDEQFVAYGDSAVEPPEEKRNNWPGHTFLQWDSSEWKSVKGDCTVTAQYADGSYTVAFNANGGSGAAMRDQTFTCGQEGTLTKCTYSRAGSTFAGWTLDAGSGRVDYEDQARVRDLTTSSSITLYAVWSPITYTIAFDGNGGSGKMAPVECVYDEPRELPANTFEKSGDPFAGWLYNDVLYADREAVSRLTTKAGEIITFKAQWGGTCQVAFHANYTGADREHPFGDTVRQPFWNGVEDALRANPFHRTGYTFVGWAKSPTASTANLSDQALVNGGTPIAAAGATLDLYAVWKANTYQVVFEMNNPPESYRDQWEQKCYPRELIWDVAEEPVKPTGVNIFDGWGTSPYRESLITDDTGGPLKNLTSTPGDHIRLYAIWKTSNDNAPSKTQSARDATFASAAEPPLLAATGTASSQLEWKNSGWKTPSPGTYSNDLGSATLSTTIHTNGTFKFEWKPIASSEKDRKETKLTFKDDTESTNLTGQISADWTSVSIDVTVPASESDWSVKFVNDAGQEKHPCMLRNIVWLPEGAAGTNTVTFEGVHVTFNDGSTQYSTNVASGTSVALPSVTVDSGYSFDSWYDAAGRRVYGAQTITADATYTAVATNNAGYVVVTNSFVLEPDKGAWIGANAEAPSARECTDVLSFKVGGFGRTLEPTIVGINGWDFTGWKVGTTGRMISPDGLAAEEIRAATTFTAQFAPHVFTNLYANLHGNNPNNPATFVATNGVLTLRGKDPTTTSYTYADLVNFVEGPNGAFRGWKPNKLFAGASYQRIETENDVYIYTNAVTQAQWESMSPETNTCTVTFLSGDDWAFSTNVVVAKGKSVCDVPPAQPRRGYSFTGWDPLPDNVMQDMTTKAQYTLVRYPITYANLKGVENSNPAEYDVTFFKEGDFPLDVLEPQNSNIRFSGWALLDAFGEIVSVTNVIPSIATNALDYAALWAYRVSYTRTAGDHIEAIAGQSSATSTKVNVYVQESVGATNAPAVVCESGYSFAGWQVVEPADLKARYGLVDDEGFLIDAAGRRVLPGSVISNVTQALTLAAVATGNVASVYTITYVLPAGVTNNPANPATFTVEDAVVFREPSARAGYLFTGWDPPGIAKGTASNVTTTATWTRAHVVGFVAGENVTLVGEPRQIVAHGGCVELPLAMTDTGYALKGWHLDASRPVDAAARRVRVDDEGFLIDAAGRRVYEGEVADITESLGFTAVATACVYTITYEGLPEGVTNNPANPATYTVTNAVVFAAPVVPEELKGEIGSFAGWMPDKIVQGSTGEVTTVAQWGRTYRVEVTVKGEGGSVALYDAKGEKVLSNPGWYATKTVLTAKATPDEGWVFAGWVDANDVLTGADPVRTFTVTGDVTLAAAFARTTHTVRFELDENLTRTGGGALVQSVAYGASATLPTVRGVGSYDLVGWQLVDATASSRPDVDEEGFLIDAAGRRVYEGEVPSVTEDLRFVGRSAEVAPYIDAKVAAEYEPKAVIEPIVVTCVHAEDATLKVTGLPSGLAFTTKEKTYMAKVGGASVKLTAPANSIYGTPSKSGLFTAAVTAMDQRQLIAATNLTFVIRAEGETVVRTEVSLVDAAASPRQEKDVAASGSDAAGTPRLQGMDVVPGKTTGQGVYVVGKKVTLKATANKGFVFSGWWLVDAASSPRQKAEELSLFRSDVDVASPLGSALVSRLASLALVVPDDDVTYEARFVTAAQDAASVQASVGGLPLVEDGEPVEVAPATNVWAGVYLEWPLVATADSAVTVAVSGLPSGLKFTAKDIVDSKTKEVKVPANTIYGTPTAGDKVSNVKITVTTAGKAKVVSTLRVSVFALPAELVGTYTGGSTNAPIGSATVTLAKTGKVSGKWISEGTTWTITAANLSGYEPETETFTADVTFKNGKLVEAIAFTFDVNALGLGTVRAVVSSPVDALSFPVDAVSSPRQNQDAPSSSPLLFSATYVDWKAQWLKTLAQELKNKTFDYEDETAGASLSGKVGASGVATVVGEFDIGAAKPYQASAKGTLVPLDKDGTLFELFVYYPPNASKGFDGYAVKLLLDYHGGVLSVLQK